MTAVVTPRPEADREIYDARPARRVADFTLAGGGR